ncbi:hypothetical protein ACJJTC_017041 [Scirpophaga incertulas]
MENTIDDNSVKSPENEAADVKVQDQACAAPPQEQPKKSRREDRNKKEDKHVDQFLKSLNSLPNIEEKFSAVCKKYTLTAEENRKLQFYIKQSDKRYALLLKEKDQLQHEFNKTVLVKSKLENLCRELQKQNKAIKEESLLKIREEEERRKETQSKFQNTLADITALLQQNNEKNAKLRDDNISMTEKFKSVVQQYQLREQQVDKMAKQMALETQLSDAKLQKASLEHQAEKERLVSEMEHMKVNLAQSHAKILELQGTETALKSQLLVYTDKYDEFQNALVKSNQVFGGFKEQMDMMSKKIKRLERESMSWKKRWETSQTALLDMCGDRQSSEEKVAAATRQLHHMQSLCRTLQGERTVLLNTLKEHNIERPPVPPPAPIAPLPPVASSSSNSKVEAMATNCAQLRQSLAHLQSQFNELTNKKEESPKPEKQKKSKSKKNKADKTQKNEEKAENKESKSNATNATNENINGESNPNKDASDNDSNLNKSTADGECNITNKIATNNSDITEIINESESNATKQMSNNESNTNQSSNKELIVQTNENESCDIKQTNDSKQIENESEVTKAMTDNEPNTTNESTYNESNANDITTSDNAHGLAKLRDLNTLEQFQEVICKLNDNRNENGTIANESIENNAEDSAKIMDLIDNTDIMEIISRMENLP